MVVGQQAFYGPSAVETLSAILNQDPPSVADPGINGLVRRCLEKDPKQRFQSAMISEHWAATTWANPAGINNVTQVVGGSCDTSGNCRAFLWKKNVLSDLNDVIAADSPFYLMYTLEISDAGEIVGFALKKAPATFTPTWPVRYAASPAQRALLPPR
jgi:probable HAF family extracellular repeat protein